MYLLLGKKWKTQNHCFGNIPVNLTILKPNPPGNVNVTNPAYTIFSGRIYYLEDNTILKKCQIWGRGFWLYSFPLSLLGHSLIVTVWHRFKKININNLLILYSPNSTYLLRGQWCSVVINIINQVRNAPIETSLQYYSMSKIKTQFVNWIYCVRKLHNNNTHLASEVVIFIHMQSRHDHMTDIMIR